MTRQSSFKRLVRARMEKTGESYTATRATLLAGNEGKMAEGPTLTASDQVIRERTGHGWEHWFGLLDEWGASERKHPEIARWLMDEQEVDGWSAQSITVSYERARMGRAVGQRDDGFVTTASKTVAVPVERLYDVFVEESPRTSWLSDGDLRERTATKPKSARFDWYDGATRVNATFEAKGPQKSTVYLEHARLPDGEEAERMKSFWRERLTVLASRLEGGEIDA